MSKLYILSLSLLLSVSSCSSRRNLVYFNDLSGQSEFREKIVNQTEPKIQAADVLDIAVNTLSAESNILFTANPTRQSSVNSLQDKDGYRVDNLGYVNFPVTGSVKLAGLTIEEAQLAMTKEINKYVKDPIVNIKYLNFKITVIGEVNRPETFTITNERINILEALGRAGDMTPYGKRENVLVIRENGSERIMVRLNMNSKDILKSPYFYLKQNDVVYVEADKTKEKMYSEGNRLMPVWLTVFSSVAVVVTAIIFNNN